MKSVILKRKKYRKRTLLTLNKTQKHKPLREINDTFTTSQLKNVHVLYDTENIVKNVIFSLHYLSENF